MHQTPGPIRVGQCRPLLPVFGENQSVLAREGGGPPWFGEAVIQCQWTIRTRTHSIGCDDKCKHSPQNSASNPHRMTAFSRLTFKLGETGPVSQNVTCLIFTKCRLGWAALDSCLVRKEQRKTIDWSLPRRRFYNVLQTRKTEHLGLIV